MPAFSRAKVWSSGEVLTAAELNAEFDNIIANFTISNLDDYSTDVTQMRLNTDPGSPGSESLPTSLAGELQRLRYMLKAIHGGAQWYASTLAGWITTAMIGDNQITNGKMADNSVGTAELINGSVTAAKLGAANKAAARITGNWTQPTSGATAYVLNSISRAGNVVTAVLNSAPTVSVGQLFSVAGCTTASFNADNLMCIGTAAGNTVYMYQSGADETGTVGAGTFQANPYFVPKEAAVTLSTITRASNVVTVVAPLLSFNVRVGQKVAVYGTTGAADPFNGLHTVTEVVSTGSFKFAQTGGDESGTVATGSVVVLAGLALTTTGRSVAVNTHDGSMILSAVGSVPPTLTIAKPVAGAFGFVMANNIAQAGVNFAVSSSNANTPSPAYVSTVDGSFGVGQSEPLTVTTTNTNSLTLPLMLNALDYEPSAATYDYYFVHGVISGYASLTATYSNLKLIAYEI